MVVLDACKSEWQVRICNWHIYETVKCFNVALLAGEISQWETHHPISWDESAEKGWFDIEFLESFIDHIIDLTEKIALTHETWTDVEKTRAAFAASRHESDNYNPEWVHFLCTDNRLIENFSPDNIDGLYYSKDVSSDILTRAYFFSQNGWWSWCVHLTFE